MRTPICCVSLLLALAELLSFSLLLTSAYNPKRTQSDPPLPLFDITDRGHFADPDLKRLKAEVEAAGGRIKDLGICMGSVVEGNVKLEDLSYEARDDLALLVARRGVVCQFFQTLLRANLADNALVFRKQESLNIDAQRALGQHFGPLHTHPTYAVPRRGDLDDVVVVYTDRDSRPDPFAFSRAELFHSDVTYEVQPPGTTILKLMTTPEVGNDTLWSSGYALYSSLSKPYQKYLESLRAVHTSFNQAASRTATINVPKRQPIETAHPLVRVHPVTGLKAVFCNSGFVSRIVGVPKAEGDNLLKFLQDSFAQQTDATVRWRWEAGDVAIWDNRVVNHSATFDAYVSTQIPLLMVVEACAHLSPLCAMAYASHRRPRNPSLSKNTRRSTSSPPKTGSKSGTSRSASHRPVQTTAAPSPRLSGTRRPTRSPTFDINDAQSWLYIPAPAQPESVSGKGSPCGSTSPAL